MAAKSSIGGARSFLPAARTRAAIAKRLAAQAGRMSTAVVNEMEIRHPWYTNLSAEERSWVSMVANEGINGFVEWFADDDASELDPARIFNVAPRSLTRKINLHQTVDLIRTTIDIVEEQIGKLMPRGDRGVLQTAILHYSREIAFASAEVYARAAESRGSWDERIEALIVDAVVRADSNEDLLSRASALGWHTQAPVTVAVGAAPGDDDFAELRKAAERLGLVAMAALHGDRLVVVLSPSSPDAEPDEQSTLDWLAKLAPHFGDGAIVVGPLVAGLHRASESARAALSGARSAKAWPEGPRILTARDLLPERALAGNGQARRELVETVFKPLVAAGGDLLETCVSFLDQGGSVEATARALFVHPNTVRYRLKRIAEVTKHSPSAARDAYVLRLAITLGRQHS
ncbi:helix-turn-helix domain-containing protein [Propionimicrobium sp. PCR01-08-3]|uniref:PucR family transcriptional regulator n=1 Tax=Propionimicrobium sp. PCR01-08-3 TaxID=3052086 RepID=UPI00255CCDBA|nr:helix-turn-helix domain-containing protein [Propionimicrobium sp. PCR01-08-3]WIY83708.1 helix-turn-helix domain-containing protein [Propionimicrobium sp. PCR01-08-3]